MPEYRPDSPVLADLATDWKSAYVHVPFCRRRCPYCDFAIVDESKDGSLDYETYTDALVAEISMESDFGPLDAVNFGGGTPSRLDPDHLLRITDSLSDSFGFESDVEMSLEMNPEDWTDEFGSALADAGFTRVSIGAQSFDPNVLRALGRLHSPDMIHSSVHGARSAGFGSVGIDLIFGHPAETSESWAATVDRAMAIGVDHISAYSLTVEQGTQLSRSIAAGAPAPDDDVQADRYELFEEVATSHGFVRYEISNHALSGHVCVYNLATWAHGEYVAFGIGAHDHRWGVRSRNHQRVDRYLDAIAAGERPRLGVEHLTDAEQERDRLMVGLRLAAGTPMTPTAERFAASDAGRRFVDAGILEMRADRMCVVDPLMTDAIIREALSVPGAEH
ncbi:MAG: radical SAM family heme chaperone HemW [Acidimicrobiia bacterium]|nr:MAG: radical SAM family heme chaperone HemW [Acidimicrobiia bacterium]